MSSRERWLGFARAIGRALTIALVLLLASAARPGGAAWATHFYFSRVPSNPYGSASGAVDISYGGTYGYYIVTDPHCPIVDDGPPCQGEYIYYDSYPFPSYLQFTVNGVAQTLTSSQTYERCTDYSGGRDCEIGFVASGTATFPGGPVTLFAQSYCPDCGSTQWYSASYAFTYDNVPPTISLSPTSGGSYGNKLLSVTATASDASGLSMASRTVTVGTQSLPQQSISWSPSGTQATFGGTVTLVKGSNSVTARVCDVFNNCSTTPAATYTYTPPAPSIQISGGTPYNANQQGLTIKWGGALPLVPTSRVVTWNGAVVDNAALGWLQDDAANDPNAYYSSFARTLQPGSNKLTARICNEDECNYDEWTTSFDGQPPVVTVFGGGYFNVPTATLSATFCDNVGLRPGNPEVWVVSANSPGSQTPFSFTRSDTTIAGCVTAARTSGTIALQTGENVAHVRIYDQAGNPGEGVASFYLDQTPPAITFSVAPGSTVGGRTLADTVRWSDEGVLDPASVVVTMNGAAIVPPLAYTKIDDRTGRSGGRIPLRSGVDTLTARICDIARNCRTLSAFYNVPFSVAVTPPATASLEPFTTTTLNFLVKNTGLSPSTFTLAVACDTTAGVVTSCTAPATVDADSGETKTVGVVVRTRAGGVATTPVALTASGGSGALAATSTGSRVVGVKSYAVALGPRGGRVTVARGGVGTQTFTVRNVGTVPTATYSFRVDCSAVLQPCTTPAPLTVDSTTPGSVQVTFTANAHGARGRVALIASYAPDSVARDSAYLDVTVRDPSKSWVSVSELNPGTAVERDLCLTVSTGPGTAYECGDLRITHPLPSTRTLGKGRTPTLVFNSALATGVTRLAANVTLAPTSVKPDSVVACATFSGGQRVCGQWLGSSFNPGIAQRITLVINRGVLPVPTRQYASVFSYTFDVTGWFGASGPSSLGSESGELILADRKDSPLGRGWWIAGVEQLFFVPGTNRIVWLGGEGSARVYEPDGTDRWRAPNLDRLDVITKTGTVYTRLLPNNLRVQFDATGKHIATVNRLGQQTSFVWTGDQLTQIKLALPTSGAPGIGAGVPSALAYTFDYATANQVRITAPPIGATLRQVDLVIGGPLTAPNLMARIRGPASDSILFDYNLFSTKGEMFNRTDREGRVQTFSFDAGMTLLSVFRVLTTATPPRTFPLPPAPVVLNPGIRFTAAEAAGLNKVATKNTSVLADSAFTLTTDSRALTTRFWVDRYGAPMAIRDAKRNVTTLERGDLRWPALVTRVSRPGGQVLGAAYDNRGNVVESTDSSRFRTVGGVKKYATTRYTWHDRWDMTRQVQQPEGEVVSFGYDTVTGNRLWQQPGTDAARRENFRYYATTGLYQAGQAPGATKSDSVFYDRLGNVDTVWSPRRVKTAMTSDAIGRTTYVKSPIDSAGTLVQEDSTAYDIMGNVLRTVARGPAMNGAAIQRMIVVNTYNKESQLLSTTRSADTGNVTNIGPITTRWAYDSAGRRVLEDAPDLRRDTTIYDLAGNVIELRLRRYDPIDSVVQKPLVITMQYDSLNRLVKRQLPKITYPKRHAGLAATSYGDSTSNPDYPRYPNDPVNPRGYTISADVAEFDYDPAGNMIRADNADARVRRVFDADGSIRQDTSIVRTWDDVDASTWTRHTYVLEYQYDLNGRVIDLKHPSAIAPVPGVNEHTTYAYDPVTGGLKTVTDPLNHQYTYVYDARGRLGALQLPRQVTEDYVYDDDDNLITHAVGRPTTVWRQTNLSYDGRGKTLRVTNTVNNRDDLLSVYDGLGHLVADTLTEFKGPAKYVTRERFTMDPFANMGLKSSAVERIQSGNSRKDSTVYQNSFQPTTGRQVLATSHVGTDTTVYNGAGDVEFVSRSPSVKGGYDDRASYYAADGKMRAADWRTYASLSDGAVPFTTTFEEFRYDALGRRVAARARRWCQNMGNQYEQSECRESNIRRTVWDGDRELYEIQMPATDTTSRQDMENDELPIQLPRRESSYDPNPLYGRVAYTNGLGVDQPLGITRLGYADKPYPTTNYRSDWGPFTVVPLWNSRGTADNFYHADGAFTNDYCPFANERDRCTLEEFPQAYAAFEPERRFDYPLSWIGSLVQHKRDASGTMYRRNRNYDPKTGRFTQEDPIGLAGGMNLYGFANGDPVTYSDPFGLTPCCLLSGLGAQKVVATAMATAQIEQEAILEYAGQRAESNTMLIMGGLELGWNIIRAGAGIARNLPQPSNVTEQVAFKSLLSGPSRTVAGASSGVVFDDAQRIAATYGGRAADWAKMSSVTKWTDRMGRKFETHWVENVKTGVKVEAKFKLVKDVR